MDPGGQKPADGYNPSGGAPPQAHVQKQPPPQGHGGQPPTGAYPQGVTYIHGGQPLLQQGQTVVVLNSPQVEPGVREWNNDLCSCFDNFNVCILSWFCPCFVIGKNAEVLEEPFIPYCLASLFIPVLVQFFVRLKIRRRLKLRGSDVDDCCKVWCCQPCALAQERNEVLKAIAQGEIVPPVIARQ